MDAEQFVNNRCNKWMQFSFGTRGVLIGCNRVRELQVSQMYAVEFANHRFLKWMQSNS